MLKITNLGKTNVTGTTRNSGNDQKKVKGAVMSRESMGKSGMAAREILTHIRPSITQKKETSIPASRFESTAGKRLRATKGRKTGIKREGGGAVLVNVVEKKYEDRSSRQAGGRGV